MATENSRKYLKIILDLLNERFFVGGDFALSKYGTVYRKKLNNIDIFTDKSRPDYSTFEPLNLGNLTLEGGYYYNNNIKVVPKAVNKILSLYPSVHTLKRVVDEKFTKWNIYTGEYNYLPIVEVYYFIGAPVEIRLFINREAFIDKLTFFPSGGLLPLDNLIAFKQHLNTKQDIQDLNNFIKFEDVQSINKDMFKQSLVQCFVDLNFNSLENSFWSNIKP